MDDEMKTVRIERESFLRRPNVYSVLESHGPNMATEVFRGSYDECVIIRDAYLKVGYVAYSG